MTAATTAARASLEAADEESRPRRRRGISNSPGDIGFRGLAWLSGWLVLTIMGLVGVFLLYRAVDALKVARWGFLTTEAWEPTAGTFGIKAVLFGTVLIGLLATMVAVPLSVGTALYISEYAPNRIRQLLISMVDLMAAVPSVIYGLWGVSFLQPQLVPIAKWISEHGNWIPILRVTGADPGDPLASDTVFTSSTFVAGLVVAMMITPIASSVMREAFMQAPLGEREGAYALGATRWGMIRAVVLPYGRGGVIGGTMLGLGRALGETIAVFMIISPVFLVQPHILQNGANSVSALIALQYGEAGPLALSALFAAGLALFLMTLVVNFLAASIVARSRSGSES